ncbi:unannotated protein [freshwater metagenome]|uniref:Unannotated protein n=1 Tax=freshwater metagenome TaxID=449393 RepID=A0A6J7PD50_9ZZZZ
MTSAPVRRLFTNSALFEAPVGEMVTAAPLAGMICSKEPSVEPSGCSSMTQLEPVGTPEITTEPAVSGAAIAMVNGLPATVA